MGSLFSLHTAAILATGSETAEQYMVADDLKYNTAAEFWNPSLAGETNDISASCVEVFQEGKMGVDYSSFPFRLAALLQNANTDRELQSDKVTSRSLFGCVYDNEEKALKCDFDQLYDNIIRECQVQNLRGVINTRDVRNIDDDRYYDANCEDIFGISPSVIKKGKFSPEKDWCPTYYDGKQGGSVTFGRIELTMDYRYTGKYFRRAFEDFWESPELGEKYKFIVENVPYCTAFGSCSEEEFFIMSNAEAFAYMDEYYGGFNYDDHTPNDLKITVTTGAKTKKMKGGKKSKKKGNSPKAKKPKKDLDT